MHFAKLSSLFLLGATIVAAQTTPPASGDRVNPDRPVTLDTFVVTGDPDARSAFDLAQGASVLTGHNLHLSVQPTLGETLASTPGVNATYYGPGASRPIIRGLGGDRVRMLENGIGSLDASNISPDHNVSVEPMLVGRIEVLRGPATLLYGSSAVGGVVNVIDNRVPRTVPDTPLSGSLETRYSSVADERTGIAAITAGNQAFALQVDGLHTATGDTHIPGFADPANPAHEGTLSNSAITTQSGSLGGTAFWTAGHAGAAVSTYDTIYGVPSGEPIHIDMKQRRADFRAEVTSPFGPFASAKARFGIADYQHAEVDNTTGHANTTFHNQAWEGRVELIQQKAGALGGTMGVQFSRSDFSAVGVEVVTPPSLTTSQALFALESLKVNRALTLQFGGRYEHQRIALGAVNASAPGYPGYAAHSGEVRQDDAVSLSLGAVCHPARDYSIGFSVAHSERIPTAQEIFSNGPHGGTAAYEIGTANLDHERSLGVDLEVRKRTGFVTGSVGAFANRFRNFIFQQRDATTYYDEASGTFRSYPASSEAEYLPIYQFVARDAMFYGGEAEVTLHLVDTDLSQFHLKLMSDYVRAQQTTDDQPLPRMPPWRLGAALRYARGPWELGFSARHAFRQDRLAPGETPTAGYTLLGADATYRIPTGRGAWELFLHGTNLGDAVARVSTSFLKDVAPLPGRNITAGVRLFF